MARTLLKLSIAGLILGAAVVTGSTITGTTQAADVPEDAIGSGEDNVYGGRAKVYESLHPNSLERVSTADRIKAVSTGADAPTEIWRVLEHGEKLECLECIPQVEKLLYNGDPRVREISAWWLRRRIFGVFGKGQVFSHVVDTLADQNTDPAKRAYAAEALGEFLSQSGVKFLTSALESDPDAGVRGATLRALKRLNSLGGGSVVTAFEDQDPTVRAEALAAAQRIHGFSDAAAVVKRFDDDSVEVRLEAVKAATTLRSSELVVPLIALLDADQESSVLVRKSAVFALGLIGDDSAREAVRGVADGDPDSTVRDAARVALRQL